MKDGLEKVVKLSLKTRLLGQRRSICRQEFTDLPQQLTKSLALRGVGKSSAESLKGVKLGLYG